MLSREGKPSPGPLPRALRAKQGIMYECGSFLREALLGGVWKGLALPETSHYIQLLGRVPIPPNPSQERCAQLNAYCARSALGRLSWDHPN